MQKNEASIFKIKYRATGKLKMGKPFAFSFFQNLDLMVSQIGKEMEDGNARFFMKRAEAQVINLKANLS